MPESLALISATFTGAARGRAIGTWSGFASITGAAGPVLGGYLAQHASWRWVFLINIPIALLVIAISLRGVPEAATRRCRTRLDRAGRGARDVRPGRVHLRSDPRRRAGSPTRSSIARDRRRARAAGRLRRRRAPLDGADDAARPVRARASFRRPTSTRCSCTPRWAARCTSFRICSSTCRDTRRPRPARALLPFVC